MQPTRLRRSLMALWIVGAALAVGVVGSLLFRAGIGTIFLAPTLTEPMSAIFMRSTIFASLFSAVAGALLSAKRENWRLSPMSDDLAVRLWPYPAVIGVAAGFAVFVIGEATALQLSAPTMAALKCAMNILMAIAIASALRAAAKAGHTKKHDQGFDETQRDISRLAWALVMLAGWLCVIVTLGATVLGYVSLGVFIMRETVWTATVLAMLFLLISCADELFPALADPTGRIGRLLQSSLALPQSSLEQAGVLLSGCARVGLLLFGWTAIMAPFGAGADDLFGRLSASNLDIHIGQVVVSPGAVLFGDWHRAHPRCAALA
jgi:small-conductance mechanosensitive channel